jgi:hypothetical protein
MSDAKFRPVTVVMADGTQTTARATGNNAAWICVCHQDPEPLIATCFPSQSVTQCPACLRRYRFTRNGDRIDEIL